VTTQRPGLAQMVHLMDSRKPLDLNPHTDHWAASPCRATEAWVMNRFYSLWKVFTGVVEHSKARSCSFLCGSIQCGEKIKGTVLEKKMGK
jgi:hypothetical protein